MRGPFKVFDADRHVVEPLDLWGAGVGGASSAVRRTPGSRVSVEVSGRPLLSADAELISVLEPRAARDGSPQGDVLAEAELRDMDRSGIDAAALLPTAGEYVIWGDHLRVEVATEICRTYNDWLAGVCRVAPDRLKGLALVPLQDVGAAVSELKRAREDLGLSGVFLRPNPVLRRQLSAPEYDALYAEAGRAAMVLWISGSPGSVLPEIGVTDVAAAEWPEGLTRFTDALARQAISPPFEAMGAMICLAGEGPLANHADLKAVFAGGGCGWLHFWVDRMDDDYFNRGEDAAVPLKPGDYVARQTAVVARGDEDNLADLADEFSRNLVWGGGRPAGAAAAVAGTLEQIVAHPALSEDSKRALLWDNAAGLLGLAP